MIDQSNPTRGDAHLDRLMVEAMAERAELVYAEALSQLEMTERIAGRPRRAWLSPGILVTRSVLAIGSVAVVVLAAAIAFAFYPDRPSVAGQPTPTPSDHRSPFVGVWISNSDADGGTQTLTVERAADDSVSIVVTDTIAMVCSGTSSTMTGTGSVEGGELVIPAPDYRCDDGTEPQTADGPPLDQQLRNLTYRHVAATDTLSVGIDDVWRRDGAEEPTADPSPAAQMRPSVQPTAAPTPGQILTPPPAPLAAPPFGLAGNGAIAFEKDGDILVADRPGGDSRPLVVGTEVDFEPMFSPDGTRLAFQRQTGPDAAVLMVADADGRNVVQVTPEPMFLGAWSFAPDGRSIVGVAVIDGKKRVIVRPLDPAATPTLLDIRMPGGWMSIVPPSFRPSSPQEILVVAQLEPDGPRGVYVYDLTTGGFRTIVEEADGNEWLWDVEWSPTGDDIRYSLSRAPRVIAADGSGDRPLDDVWTTTYGNQIGPRSNDDTRVVVARDTGGVGDGQQSVVSTTGEGEPLALTCGPTTNIECPQSWIWSPDDSTLIGTTYRETGSGEFTPTYQLADTSTGRVTQLDWDGHGTPTWQRVAP